MQEDQSVLEEVVVVGYGTQTRKTVTSAISKMDGKTLESMPVNLVGDGMKGRIAGLQVATTDATPGSAPKFLIRGGSSINNSNDPIVLVDGAVREMAGLNPNDIESIEVLQGRRVGRYLRFTRIERRDSHHHQEGRAPQGTADRFRGAVGL